MTKMKSKKMTKSTFAIVIMAIAMVAMLAFGGTYAYFTASATARSKEFTTGTIHLVDNSPRVISAKYVVPGDVLITEVSYNPADTTVKSIAIVHYTLTAADGITVPTPNAAWKAVNGKAGYYYQVINVTEEGALDGNFVNEFIGEVELTGDVNWDQADDDKPAAMGVEISLVLEAKSIQYAHLTGEGDAEVAVAAVAELFNA